MTLEEKLKETLSTYFYKIDIRFAIKDILTICQEAIAQAKIEENERWIKIFNDDNEDLYVMLASTHIEYLETMLSKEDT